MAEGGSDLLNMHPYGGLSQYVVSPDSKIALLPDSFDLHSAARLGYAGTSYAALKKAGVAAGSTVLINGVTGTLGVSAVAIALGLGATKILGIGRNPDRLKQVEAFSPKGTERVATFRSTEDNDDGDAADWVKTQTAGLGVDAYIDCLGVGGAASTTEALVRSAVKVGGRAILVAGGAQGDISAPYYEWFMRDVALIGSVWFTDGEIDELIALIGAGVIDLSWLENQTFPLDKVNDALDAASDRPGGFINVVVIPDGAPKKD
jgi:alcohol dehydrogenase